MFTAIKKIAILIPLLLILGLQSCLTWSFYQIAFDRSLRSKTDQISQGLEAYQGVQVSSFDQLKLQAYWLPASKPSQITVLIAHGYNSKVGRMLEIADWYRQELQCNVLLPVARGHGSSDGTYVGLGWHDRLDIRAWVDWIIQKQGQDERILLHGYSMGAVSVLLSAAASMPHNVKALVSDSAFSSAKDEVAYLLRSIHGFADWGFMQQLDGVLYQHAGYHLSDVSSLEAVKKINLPIYFVHGGADDFVPVSNVHEIYAAAIGPKGLLIVPNAGHGLSFRTDPVAWQHSVGAFVHEIFKQDLAD